MRPLFIMGLMLLPVLLVVIVLPLVILIRMRSKRSRLLVQGALLLVLGVLSLFAAIGVGAAEGGDIPQELATNLASTLSKIAVIFILSALASWFLTYDFGLRRDEEGGASDAQ